MACLADFLAPLDGMNMKSPEWKPALAAAYAAWRRDLDRRNMIVSARAAINNARALRYWRGSVGADHSRWLERAAMIRRSLQQS